MEILNASFKHKVNNLTHQYGTRCGRSKRHHYSKSNTMVLFNNYGIWRSSTIHSSIPRNIHQTRCRRLLNVCMPCTISCKHFENIILVSIICLIIISKHLFKTKNLIIGLVNVMSFHCYFKAL